MREYITRLFSLQTELKCKLATVKSFRADILNSSPSSEPRALRGIRKGFEILL